MKLIITFITTLLISHLTWAHVDLLPQFQSRWDGNWSLQYSENETFYRLQTAANISPAFVEYNSEKPISFEQKYLHFRLRVSSFQAWGGIEIRLSSDESYKNYYAINIPYYSDIDFNIIQPKQWADYTVTLGEAKAVGKPDQRKIRYIGFYIQGLNVAPEDLFTVDFSELSIRSSMHSGIVSFTFDDGYAEHFEAAQIMAKYGLRGTAYIMTNELDDPGYLTSQQLKQLSDDYSWGISSHHAKPITDMTEEEYLAEMDKTIEILNPLGQENDVFHFAYPLGKQNRERTLPWIRAKFLTARVAGGGAETLPPSDWYMLKTFNVTPDISAKDLLKRIQRAKDNNEWLILMFHKFTTEETSNQLLVYPISQFKKLCEGMTPIGIPVHPVHEVYEAFHE